MLLRGAARALLLLEQRLAARLSQDSDVTVVVRNDVDRVHEAARARRAQLGHHRWPPVENRAGVGVGVVVVVAVTRTGSPSLGGSHRRGGGDLCCRRGGGCSCVGLGAAVRRLEHAEHWRCTRLSLGEGRCWGGAVVVGAAAAVNVAAAAAKSTAAATSRRRERSAHRGKKLDCRRASRGKRSAQG